MVGRDYEKGGLRRFKENSTWSKSVSPPAGIRGFGGSSRRPLNICVS